MESIERGENSSASEFWLESGSVCNGSENSLRIAFMALLPEHAVELECINVRLAFRCFLS